MKTSDFKFLVLAVLCLLLVLPIFGYVQKQAALRPDPGLDADARRERRHSQREALRNWLQHRVSGVAAVAISPDDPHIFNVALKPDVTHDQAIAQARQIQQVMTIYFHEGQSGAVTLVILRRSPQHDVLSIVTGLPMKGNVHGNTWHVFSGHTFVQ